MRSTRARAARAGRAAALGAGRRSGEPARGGRLRVASRERPPAAASGAGVGPRRAAASGRRSTGGRGSPVDRRPEQWFNSHIDLRDTPDEAEFRAGVRAWLEANLPAGDPREWSRKIFDAGYAGLTWPEEYGGKGAPYSHQAIALEEFARAEAPPHMGVIGLGMAGPTIMAHGTEEQKQRYLVEDPVGRGDLVPGLLRARRRLRPLGGAHADRRPGRPLRRQRPEGLVVVRAHRRLLHPRRPQRPGLRAARGPHVRDRRHEGARASRCGR